MQRTLLRSLAIALAIIATMISAAGGQSLGDIARENRENQAAPAAQPVIVPPANKSPEQSASDRRAEQRFAQQRLAEQRAAEQWKRQILAQKDKILTLQARIDHLKATLQFADVSTHPYAGPYNRDQARQLQRVTRLQQQLDQQQRKLDQMRDSARHAGMHTAVYDP